jgi:hypothetical protein
MIIKALITSPRSARYGVTFYHPQGSEGPQDWTAPSWYLPCYSFEHAQAVANAFNAGHVQPQPVPERHPVILEEARPIGDLVNEDIEAAKREGRHYLDPK